MNVMRRILTIAVRVSPRAADAAWRHKSASAVEMRETAGPIGVSSPIPTQSARLYSRWRRNRATGQLEGSWLTQEPAGAGPTDGYRSAVADHRCLRLGLCHGPQHGP